MLRELWRLEGHGVFLCPEPQRVVIATSLFTAFRSIPSPGIHTWPHRVRLDPSSLPTWALVAPVSVHKDSAWSVVLPTSVALSSWPPGFPRMSLPFCQDNFPWRFLQGKSAPQIPAFFLRPPSLLRVGDAASTFLSLLYKFCPTSGLCGF